MSLVARETGLSRESLYKALSGDRTPGFDTVLKVMAALGFQLHAEPLVSKDVAPGVPTDDRAASSHQPRHPQSPPTLPDPEA